MAIEFNNKKLGFVVCLFFSLYVSRNLFLLNFMEVLAHERLNSFKNSFDLGGWGRRMALARSLRLQVTALQAG